MKLVIIEPLGVGKGTAAFHGRGGPKRKGRDYLL